jgi:hypothetical protein
MLGRAIIAMSLVPNSSTWESPLVKKVYILICIAEILVSLRPSCRTLSPQLTFKTRMHDLDLTHTHHCRCGSSNRRMFGETNTKVPKLGIQNLFERGTRRQQVGCVFRVYVFTMYSACTIFMCIQNIFKVYAFRMYLECMYSEFVMNVGTQNAPYPARACG